MGTITNRIQKLEDNEIIKGFQLELDYPKIRIQYRMHNRTRCKRIHRQHTITIPWQHTITIPWQHTITIPWQHNNSTQDDRTIRHYANNKIQRHTGVKPIPGCNKPERKCNQDKHTGKLNNGILEATIPINYKPRTYTLTIKTGNNHYYNGLTKDTKLTITQ